MAELTSATRPCYTTIRDSTQPLHVNLEAGSELSEADGPLSQPNFK